MWAFVGIREKEESWVEEEEIQNGSQGEGGKKRDIVLKAKEEKKQKQRRLRRKNKSKRGNLEDI